MCGQIVGHLGIVLHQRTHGYEHFLQFCTIGKSKNWEVLTNGVWLDNLNDGNTVAVNIMHLLLIAGECTLQRKVCGGFVLYMCTRWHTQPPVVSTLHSWWCVIEVVESFNCCKLWILSEFADSSRLTALIYTHWYYSVVFVSSQRMTDVPCLPTTQKNSTLFSSNS